MDAPTPHDMPPGPPGGMPTYRGTAPVRRPPGIFALPFGILILLAGLWGGLGRLGYALPAVDTSAVEHGLLMTLGFLGTLISIERAVALGRWWAWAVPALSAAGSIALVAGAPRSAGYAALTAAGVLLVVVYGRIDRIQRSTHNTLMGLAAVGWAVAAALVLAGRAIPVAVPWLAIFLVVTITAERLELSRMLRRSRPVRASLVVAIGVMIAGATLALWLPDAGVRLTGVAMVAMAIWLARYDLARRTIHAQGVTRFMAAGLLAGYAWLGAGGALWAAGGHQLGGALYDAQLHMIFLGFVMSMVFAHAPVIAPAVIRRPLPYFPVFYAPLALLHAGLLLRVVVGDAAGVVWAWQIGGVLNEVALLLFVAVTVGAFAFEGVASRRRRASVAGAVAAAEPSRWARGRLVAGLGGAAVGAAIVAAAVLVANSGTGPAPAAPAGSATGSAEVVDAAQAAAGVDVSLVEMKILPAHLVVEPGSHLVLHVTNDGTMPHDLRLATGQQTPMLDPGQSATLDAGTITGSVAGWCTVPGHRQAGMTMSITTASPGAGTPSRAPSPGAGPMGPMAGTGGMHGMVRPSGTPSSEADAVSQDLSATPPDGWRPVDATLPPAADTTVHRVTWHVRDVVTAVAPDVTQLLWTFDGRVPGPVLRGKVGDRFEITLVNDTQMAHNIDFHAESGPPATVMAPVPPGGSHTYSFVADHAGAFLYHCSVEPMLMHLGNGMYGAIIIDPPDLPPAGAEYVLVGSELFFGPQGQVGDYDKMLADRPDAVVFNGYPFAYRHRPLTATVGELVRIWVVDAGPSRSLAFHVIGAPMTTEYLNGAYLLKDGRSAGGRSGAAQTLPVDPGNGGFVELTFTQPGTYPFLSHVMADAVIGAAGEFHVTG